MVPATLIRRWFRFGPLLLAFLILTGCGPSIGQVSGTVFYRDKILQSGDVMFVGSDGQRVTLALEMTAIIPLSGL